MNGWADRNLSIWMWMPTELERKGNGVVFLKGKNQKYFFSYQKINTLRHNVLQPGLMELTLPSCHLWRKLRIRPGISLHILLILMKVKSTLNCFSPQTLTLYKQKTSLKIFTSAANYERLLATSTIKNLWFITNPIPQIIPTTDHLKTTSCKQSILLGFNSN